MMNQAHENPIIRIAENRNRHAADTSPYSHEKAGNVNRLHHMIPSYGESSLYSLPDLAAGLGIRAVYLKDESTRFGLKAFKGLGGIYAMFRIICRELGLNPETAAVEQIRACPERLEKMTFITTTDGNHGKGVSWAAGFFGCGAYVYMPKGTVEVRAEAVRKAGSAKVEITDMKYDDCVAWTAQLAAEKGWYLIQDTAWEGYEEIPEWIMQGYTTILFEAEKQMDLSPTHLFLQAGVGSMAAAIAGAAGEIWGKENLHIWTVEPTEAACFFESFLLGDGKAHMAAGSGMTEMAGLNCGMPCALAWDILGAMGEGGISCTDDVTETGIRYLARHDPPIIAGESGAVTAGMMKELETRPELRKRLGLTKDSVVFIINTEGDTDPENRRRILDNRNL